MHEMNMHHRINVWRTANQCPVCGAKRGYAQANPGGIECNCSDEETCGYTEFFPTSFIHGSDAENDRARWEVLDRDNHVKPGWIYTPSPEEKGAMEETLRKEKERKVWWDNLERKRLKKK